MKRLWGFGIYLLLVVSTVSYSCPASHYEMCVLPRPWGGCAQKACIPNGGKIVGGATDALADLNQGFIHLGHEVIKAPAQVGRKLAGLDSKVDIDQLVKVGFVASAILNGAVCLASGGTSPGSAYVDSTGQSTVFCSTNACGCAVLSLYGAYKANENSNQEQRQKLEQIANSQTIQSYLNSANFEADMEQEAAALGMAK